MADLDATKFAQDCIKAINEKIKNLTHMNIIVAGKTGVGKSTLINAVFRENLVETGIGKPVTQHMRCYSKKNYPLSIYDTRGFELGKNAQDDVKHEVLNTIQEGLATQDVNKAIHCIWYCINATSNRIEEEELKWLRSFTDANKTTQVPVIIVLTQAISHKSALAMKNVILNENVGVASVVPVLALDYEISDEYMVKAYGLDTLIKIMSQVLPDELQDTLQNVQKASLDEKVKRSQAIVASSVAAAFGEGVAPIPFSDAALLVPTQMAMIAGITVCFGLDINTSILTGFVSATLGAGGATIRGKTVVSNILKFIPGVGTVVGGAISGATAGLITTALGEAYISLMTQIFKGEMSASDIGTEKGKDAMAKLFKEQLKRKKK